MYSSPACLAVFAVVEILIRPTVIDLLFVVFIVVCLCVFVAVFVVCCWPFVPTHPSSFVVPFVTS